MTSYVLPEHRRRCHRYAWLRWASITSVSASAIWCVMIIIVAPLLSNSVEAHPVMSAALVVGVPIVLGLAGGLSWHWYGYRKPYWLDQPLQAAAPSIQAELNLQSLHEQAYRRAQIVAIIAAEMRLKPSLVNRLV